MIRSYLISALRRIRRDGFYSLVQVFGLSIGMAVFFLIWQYVAVERSFDEHFTDSELIYRIASEKVQNGVVQDAKSSSSVCLASYIDQNINEVAAVTRIHKLDAERITVSFEDENGETKVFDETQAFHTDAQYFDVFSTEFILGGQDGIFLNPNEIVLTESLAFKYFGKDNPINKTVTIVDDMEMSYRVVAVVADVPSNSHFQYKLLISDLTFVKQHPNWRWNAWNWDYFHTYIRLREPVLITAIEEELNQRILQDGADQFQGSDYSMNFIFQPLTDIYLHSDLGNEFGMNGNGDILFYLMIVAVSVLVLAWVNYISLASARAGKGAKDIGIRKVVGAGRITLIAQLMLESLIVNLLALSISVVLISIVLPYIKVIIGTDLQLTMLSKPYFWIISFIGLMSSTLISGLYPAILMTGDAPTKMLKGAFKSSLKGVMLRKSLLMLQFVVTLSLMTSSLIVYRQIEHLRNRDLGFSPEQVLITNIHRAGGIEDFWQKMDFLKGKSASESGIHQITASGIIPGLYLNYEERFKRGHESREEADFLKFFMVDYDFFDVYNMTIMEGRAFKKTMTSNAYEVVLNESAAKKLGFSKTEQIVGQPVTWISFRGTFTECRVIGIVKDYDQQALSGSEPSVFFLNRPYENWIGMEYLSVKLETGYVHEVVESLKKSYEAAFPGNHFTYFFLNDRFASAYARETQFGNVFAVFSIIGMVIALIGLMALSSYLLNLQKKEISIRKVLGADTWKIIQLFVFQYLKILGISFLVGLPIVFIAMKNWMDQFPYRIAFDWVSYIVPTMVFGLLTLALIVFQTVGIARSNPGYHLRSE